MQTKIIITHDKEQTVDVVAKLKRPVGNPKQFAEELRNYIQDIALGVRNASVDLQVSGDAGAYGSGTLTLAAVVATDTCTINGVTFTCVASGATGNQFNVGGTDTISATNLAAAINASVTALVTGVVTASSVGAVVTVTAVEMGLTGNAIAIAGNAHITASGARLTGGTYTAQAYKFGM